MKPANYEEVWARVEWEVREMLRHLFPTICALLDLLVDRTQETQARWLAKPVIQPIAATRT